MRRLALVFALLVLLAASVAQASQIHYRDVGLREARESATHLVTATFRGTSRNHYGAGRFRVERFVRGTGPAPGSEVFVFSREAWAWDMVRRAFRATGRRRSPLLDRLSSSSRLRRGERHCLLLVAGPANDFTLAVADGHVAGACHP